MMPIHRELIVRIPCLALESLEVSPFIRVISEDRGRAIRHHALARRGRAMADEIAVLIPDASPANRRLMLSLRRDLHNGRRPPVNSGSPELLLPERIVRRLRDWSIDFDELSREEVLAGSSWARAEQVARKDVFAKCRGGLFAAAVALSNPEIVAHAAAVPADEPSEEHIDNAEGRVRSVDRALWALRWRATFRPVPFGLYSSTSRGTWGTSKVPNLSRRIFQQTGAPSDAEPTVIACDSDSCIPAGSRRAGDSYAEAVSVDPQMFGRFTREVEWFGARVVDDTGATQRKAAAALIEGLLGDARSITLESLLSILRGVVERAELPDAFLTDPSLLAEFLGLIPPSCQDALVPVVETALAFSMPMFSPRTVPAGFAVRPGRRRAALRFFPVIAPSGGVGGHVTFWGGELMSYFPRYLPRGGLADRATSNSRPLVDDSYRAWLSGWPHLVDLVSGSAEHFEVRPAYTRATMVTKGKSSTRRLRTNDVLLTVNPRGTLNITHRRTGTPIEPVYFGMLAPRHLPTEFQWLLAVSPSRQTAMQSALHAVNLVVAGRIAQNQDVSFCGEVWLSDHVLLSSPMWIVRSRVLPFRLDRRIGRTGFLRFHHWASDIGLPTGHVSVRVVGGSLDGQPLDLGYPEGVDAVRRLAEGAEALLVHSLDHEPFASGSAVPLVAEDGSYRVEYAIELSS